MVASILWGSGEDLALMVLQEAAVGLADDTLPEIRRRTNLCEERDLEQHGAGQVDTLKQLEVDVEVERKLSLAFETFLLGRDLRVALHLQTLCEKLLLPVAAADLLERSLGLVDKTGAESAETNLYERAVEENLGVDVEVADGLLQVRHEPHVASLVVLVVQSQEVNLAKHCPRADDTLAVPEEVCAECLNEGGCVGGERARCSGGVEVGWDCLPSLVLEDLNNRGGLIMLATMSLMLQDRMLTLK